MSSVVNYTPAPFCFTVVDHEFLSVVCSVTETGGHIL